MDDIEVYETILKLDSNKGPGPDNIHVKALKFVANKIAPHLKISLMAVLMKDYIQKFLRVRSV